MKTTRNVDYEMWVASETNCKFASFDETILLSFLCNEEQIHAVHYKHFNPLLCSRKPLEPIESASGEVHEVDDGSATYMYIQRRSR